MSKVYMHRGYRIQKDAFKWEILGLTIDNGQSIFTYRYSTLAAAKLCIDRNIASGEWEEKK